MSPKVKQEKADIIELAKRVMDAHPGQNLCGLNSDDVNQLVHEATKLAETVVWKKDMKRHVRQELLDIIPQIAAQSLIEEFDRISSPRAVPNWIRTTASHAMGRYFEFNRAAKRDPNKSISLGALSDQLLPSKELPPYESLLKTENQNELREFLRHHLNTRQFEVVVRRLEGQDFKEIGLALHISAGAARMLHVRAVEILRKHSFSFNIGRRDENTQPTKDQIECNQYCIIDTTQEHDSESITHNQEVESSYHQKPEPSENGQSIFSARMNMLRQSFAELAHMPKQTPKDDDKTFAAKLEALRQSVQRLNEL